jgi:hypothetical protein
MGGAPRNTTFSVLELNDPRAVHRSAEYLTRIGTQVVARVNSASSFTLHDPSVTKCVLGGSMIHCSAMYNGLPTLPEPLEPVREFRASLTLVRQLPHKERERLRVPGNS